MYSTSITDRRVPTLRDRYLPERNAFGLLRLVLALGVLVAHTWPLGFGLPSPGWYASSGQSDLGMLSVQGFFVLSGFLVAGSGLRSSLPRFGWHRFLRIFPGLWACLLVTALVFAPLAAYLEIGTLAGFWSHPAGPLDYLLTNWFASMEQYPISGLLADTPFGRMLGAPSAFDGSLWSLRYELVCYAVVGALVATAVLRRAPRAVLLLLLGLYALILRDLLTAPHWAVRPPEHGAVGPFPLIGSFAANHLLYLGFLFLLGTAARLYMHRLPMTGGLALLAAVLVAASLWQGGFIAIGLPGYAYLLLYLAVAGRGRLTVVGRDRDYSYGTYLYAFPVQQLVALFGGARYGLVGYLLLSLAGTLVFAVASWHLVERPALRLRDYRGWPPRYAGPAPRSRTTRRRPRHRAANRWAPTRSKANLANPTAPWTQNGTEPSVPPQVPLAEVSADGTESPAPPPPRAPRRFQPAASAQAHPQISDAVSAQSRQPMQDGAPVSHPVQLSRGVRPGTGRIPVFIRLRSVGSTGGRPAVRRRGGFG
ncbi:acyltransferase family protein [Plantactinospora sp. DSM 117369]